MRFSLEGFKKVLQQGFLLPNGLAYSYVDEVKFTEYKEKHNWKASNITTTFDELQQRMSKSYFSKVLLAQMAAMDYAALQFPVYSFLVAEDLSDDWLAIVDFHKKHARDHSLHQPLTAYIAASMLGFGNTSQSLPIPAKQGNLLEFCVDVVFTSEEAGYIIEKAGEFGLPENMLKDNNVSREYWKGLFYRTVVLSALFHDIGYPWQYVNRIGDALRKNVNYLHPTDNIATRIIEDFNDRMVFLPLRHYKTTHCNDPVVEKVFLNDLTQAALQTHGFPGAVAFLSLNDAVRRFPPTSSTAKVEEFLMEWAAMGIVMHDMEKIHRESFPQLRVNIAQDPLAAIVSLADFLEEFNRPKVCFQPKSRQSRIRYYSDCSWVEIEMTPQGVLDIKMKYNSDNSKAIAAEFKAKETSDYFHPANGYVDLSPIGINGVSYTQL